jgi:hypothetical protein
VIVTMSSWTIQAEGRQAVQGDQADPLAHFPLPMAIDDVLLARPGAPCVFAGQSPDGRRWLVGLTSDDANARRWLCAPASDLAISCVRSGRAQPADVFRHSGTGAVEVITLEADGRFFQSLRLCAELRDDELSFAGPASDVLS